MMRAGCIPLKKFSSLFGNQSTNNLYVLLKENRIKSCKWFYFVMCVLLLQMSGASSSHQLPDNTCQFTTNPAAWGTKIRYLNMTPERKFAVFVSTQSYCGLYKSNELYCVSQKEAIKKLWCQIAQKVRRIWQYPFIEINVVVLPDLCPKYQQNSLIIT